MRIDQINNNLEQVIWRLMAESGLVFSRRHFVTEKLKELGYGPALRWKPEGAPAFLQVPLLQKEGDE